jgi:FkbM family methyltransferase
MFIGKNDLCFDIGAHLGNRSDAWLQLGANVIALEPQPSCINFLDKRFGHEKQFTLIKKAVGKAPGTATLHISSLTPTVTTLADAEWRNMINDDTSFNVEWDESVEVPVITLDSLIETYGIPVFCKIDVENFELEVLLGLSTTIPALSIEFFKETMDITFSCIERLNTLGDYEYNWSFGESQKMDSINWVDGDTAKNKLSNLSSDKAASGDLYARLRQDS